MTEQLARVTGGGASESYLYDETGQRIRKTNHVTGVSTFYPFAGYEQTNGGAVTKHYAFNGRFVAVRAPGGSLSFLLQDQINSTIHVLDAYANKQASRGYYTFGATRYSEGVMPTDHHFTSQKEDGTGLYYYGARYYDPQIGSFLSPDTVVPDPTKLIDYNRYLYAAGNPVKYNDPSGHCATEVPTSGDEDEMQAYTECWRLAGAIFAMYNNDLWWQERFSSDLSTFIEQIATMPQTDAEWMQDQLNAWDHDFKMRTGQPVGRIDWYESPKFALPEAEIMGLFEGKGACEVWDCGAIYLDIVTLGAQVSRDTAILSIPVTTAGGFSGATLGEATTLGLSATSIGYVAVEAANGKASGADLVVVVVTNAAGQIPVVGEFAATGQLIWDLLDPFHPW